MLLGYCVNMIATDPYGVGYEWIPHLKQMGFDYVELPVAEMMRLNDRDFQALVVEELKNSQLPCRCCNNFFPPSYRLTGPCADHDAALAYAEKALGRMAALGAQYVVFGSAGARNYPAGFPKAEAEKQLLLLLQKIADLAAAQKITIVLEHLNYLESNLLNHLHECAALAERLNHPAVQLLVDCYHMRMVSDATAHASAFAKQIQHVHIARTLGRTLPKDGDEEDWKAFFDMLRHAQYAGGVSLEANVADRRCCEDELSASLRFIKGFLR